MGNQSSIFQFEITKNAKAMFIDYITSHPEAYQKEVKCSGICNLERYVKQYFDIELHEKDHADVVQMISDNDGIMDTRIMWHWIKENFTEVYIKKEYQCDEQ